MSFNGFALTFNDGDAVINVENENGFLKANVCVENHCVDESRLFSNFEVVNVELIDFDGDKKKEIDVEVNGNSSPVQHIFAVKGNHIVPYVDATGNKLIFSTYEKKLDSIVTHTLGMPSSIDRLYKVTKEFNLIQVIEDRCVDCNEIKRTELSTGNRYLVTNEVDIFDRKPIFKKISEYKSYILNKDGSKAKGYLIKDDVCQILGYAGDDFEYAYVLYGKNKSKFYILSKDLK